jgi:cytochrome c oxidase subunit 2
VLLAACTRETPFNTLAPAGPVAEKQADLFWLVFWIAAAVFVLVEGALVVVMFRFRRRSADDTPRQIHGNTRLEVMWTILPALLLAGVAVPTVGTIFDLAEAPPGSMVVKVTGHQWWWEIEYPGLGVVTANEAHIPTGEQVIFELTSDDVIHSWWVPRLAGKMDLVPGRTNTMNLAADQPGTYRGQCAEFCGLSHANMRFRVVAQEPADFDAWVDRQLAEAAAPDAEVEQILPTCFACHAIRGQGGPPPEGTGPPPDPGAMPRVIGPDLTHIGGRQTIAGGMLPNDPEALARWLRDPPAVKPGSKMIDYNLTEPQIEALVEYLQGLE